MTVVLSADLAAFFCRNVLRDYKFSTFNFFFLNLRILNVSCNIIIIKVVFHNKNSFTRPAECYLDSAKKKYKMSCN